MLLDWLIRGRCLPRLIDQPTDKLPGSEWPSVTVVIPARNEEAALPASIRSLATQDYPHLKIIVVDDRSTDATPSLLAQLAQQLPSVTVKRIEKLPGKWLGKTHALWTGAKLAGSVEWFLFSDADVLYEPLTVKRAIRYAASEKLDLLTLYPGMMMRGFWERAMMSYFTLISFFGYAPWRVNNPKSGAYFAIGAFTLVRRDTYFKMGGHQALALEVVDDARLCRLVKRAGGRVKVIIGLGSIRIRWQDGISGIVSGLTKNFFAGFNYRLGPALAAACGLLLVSVVPFVGLLTLPRAAGWLGVLCVLAIFILYALASRGTAIPFWYAVGHPVAALLMVFITLRSATVTLLDGGVVWRGTHYSLQELKNGQGIEQKSQL